MTTEELISVIFQILQGGLTPVLTIAVVMLWRENRRLLDIILNNNETNALHRELLADKTVESIKAELVEYGLISESVARARARESKERIDALKYKPKDEAP